MTIHRACLDANVFLSYLLNPDSASPPAVVVRACLDHRFTGVISVDVLEEVLRSWATKTWLRDRISEGDIVGLISALRIAVVDVPRRVDPIPARLRDINDDYLIDIALRGDASYIVSGDKDVTSLSSWEHIHIVTPREFAVLLKLLD